MPRIAVSRPIPAPHTRVWEALADLESHQLWMRDAHSIVFLDDRRRGVGTRMEVETRIGPFRTLDLIEVVGWEEGHSIDVAHSGLVGGVGALRVTPDDGGAVVEWVEDLIYPWWLGGAVTAWLARPVLAAVWKGNLRRLASMLTDP